MNISAQKLDSTR